MVKQKAIAQIPALVISGTVGILMAYNGMSYWGIATQSLVYIAIINLYFWYFSPWRPTFHLDFRPLKEMFGFSSKVLLTNIFIQTNNNIFSAIIGRLFLPKDVGFYTQANKWNTMGASLISGTINSVAQPVLAQITDNSNRQQAVSVKCSASLLTWLFQPCSDWHLSLRSSSTWPSRINGCLVYLFFRHSASGGLSCLSPPSAPTWSSAKGNRTSTCGIPSPSESCRY